MFSTTGDPLVEDQQAILNELNKKVEQVYRGIIGSNEANIEYVYSSFLLSKKYISFKNISLTLLAFMKML